MSQPPRRPVPKPVEPAEPAEEDTTSAKEKEYALNPLQCEQEIKIGRFYMKKAAWKAAAMRFDEASRWNPQSSEAWLLLGEAREKMRDKKAAAEAYRKYLEIDAEAKNAAEIRKRIEKLK